MNGSSFSIVSVQGQPGVAGVNLPASLTLVIAPVLMAGVIPAYNVIAISLVLQFLQLDGCQLPRSFSIPVGWIAGLFGLCL